MLYEVDILNDMNKAIAEKLYIVAAGMQELTEKLAQHIVDKYADVEGDFSIVRAVKIADHVL